MILKSATTYLILFFFLFCSYHADAQRGSKYKRQRSKSRIVTNYRGGVMGSQFRPYYFASFNINALNYFGDLAPVNRAASTDVSFTRPGFGGNFGYKYSSRMAVRIAFNYGRVQADDISSDPNDEQSNSRYLRNLSFRNDIKELSGGFEIYLFPNGGSANLRPPFNAYFFIGAAVFHHEPKGLVPDLDYTTGGTNPVPEAGQWVKLRPLGTEGQYLDAPIVSVYNPIQFSIPLAIGARFRLVGPFDAGIEFGYRFLFTDYIDDVSTNYVGHEQFDSNLARIMADRSAEPISVASNIARAGFNISSRPINGTTYYSASDIAGGLSGSSSKVIRGNPSDNDMIFITTLKVTYVLGRHRKEAKFR